VPVKNDETSKILGGGSSIGDGAFHSYFQAKFMPYTTQPAIIAKIIYTEAVYAPPEMMLLSEGGA